MFTVPCDYPDIVNRHLATKDVVEIDVYLLVQIVDNDF